MLAAAAPAAPIAAQTAEAGGATAVSLEAGNGYVLGLWRQLSPRTRAGVEVGAALSRAEGDGREQDVANFALRPTLKLFSAADGAVRPYTLVGAYVERSGQKVQQSGAGGEFSTTSTEAGARAGVGLEWMPVRRLAVSGHVGVRGGYLKTAQTSGGTEQELTGWSAGTFTSGFSLSLFF